jgi:MFS family permease
MGLRGLFQPLYRVGLNAMISDLIPPEGRSEAFALVRMFNNVGVGIGPAIGGFVVVSSYVSSFYAATITLTFFGTIIAIFARETMPDTGPGRNPSWMSSITGYGSVFKNRRVLYFLFSFSLLKICSVMLWTLMAVYSKENYHLPENQYGLLQTTNATMVVLFQVGLTRITNRYAPLRVLAIGSTIYAFGVGSIALGQGFWGFWLSYLVVTIGELMVMPTASTMA